MLWLSVRVTKTSQPWAYFGLHTRAWELAFGALAATGFDYISRLPKLLGAALSWVGLGAIALSALVFTASTPFPGSAALLPVLGATLVIIGGCAGAKGGAQTLLGLRPMQFTGKVSYSWYLWHWPILIIAPLALAHPLSPAQTVAAVLASLLAAVITYHFVEHPIRSRATLARPRFGLPLGAGLVSLSLLVALAVESPGVAVGRDEVIVPASSASLAAQPVLATAAQLRALPRNVTPALSAAPADRLKGCLDGLDASAPTPDGACVLGDLASDRTVVLFGDSHAWQWTDALASIALQRHWKLMTFTKSACPA